ncbi:unnamed protein product [Natator depressus]
MGSFPPAGTKTNTTCGEGLRSGQCRNSEACVPSRLFSRDVPHSGLLGSMGAALNVPDSDIGISGAGTVTPDSSSLIPRAGPCISDLPAKMQLAQVRPEMAVE